MILALIADLFFVSRVHAAAKTAELDFRIIDTYQTVAEFLGQLHSLDPKLIVLDLNSALPWPEWLPAAKFDKQTRDIPWLAFGSHMNPRRLAAARHAGADKVVPKSQFAQELSKSLGKIAKRKM